MANPKSTKQAPTTARTSGTMSRRRRSNIMDKGIDKHAPIAVHVAPAMAVLTNQPMFKSKPLAHKKANHWSDGNAAYQVSSSCGAATAAPMIAKVSHVNAVNPCRPSNFVTGNAAGYLWVTFSAKIAFTA